MPTKQGSLDLLQHPVAQQLLASKIPARVAYVWTDGTPRVVPIWFHWDGKQIVLGGPPDHPKITALQHNPKVAVTIDDGSSWPYKVLMIRGTASVTILTKGPVPEYALSAERYLGPEQGKGWIEQFGGLMTGRIAITPEWVGVLDFEQSFPNAVERAMERAQAAQQG